MRDVIEQLSAYGEAAERAAMEQPRDVETPKHAPRSRRWARPAAWIAAAAVVLLSVGVVALTRADEEGGLETVFSPDDETIVTPDGEESVTTTVPTTTTAAPPPLKETIEVPVRALYLYEPSDQFNCATANSSFEVEFVDETGESVVVKALTDRFFAPSIDDPPVNATCSDVVAGDGGPAVLFSAVLEAPAAERYESITFDDPFSGEPDTEFSNMPRALAEAGISFGGSNSDRPDKAWDYDLLRPQSADR